MSILMIVSKVIFYTLGLGLALSLNFNFVRFCIYFKNKYFATVENNLNKAGYSLFPPFTFSLDFKDFKHDERWLAYFIVTVPTLAVLIRSVYYDHFYETYGYYVLVWQVIIQGMAFFYAKFLFERWEKTLRKHSSNENIHSLISKDLSSDQVETIVRSFFPNDKKEDLRFDLLKKISSIAV